MAKKIFDGVDIKPDEGWQNTATLFGSGFDPETKAVGVKVVFGYAEFYINTTAPADNVTGWPEERMGEFPADASEKLWVRAKNGPARIVGSVE